MTSTESLKMRGRNSGGLRIDCAQPMRPLQEGFTLSFAKLRFLSAPEPRGKSRTRRNGDDAQ
jgi:hypothetical protein